MSLFWRGKHVSVFIHDWQWYYRVKVLTGVFILPCISFRCLTMSLFPLQLSMVNAPLCQQKWVSCLWKLRNNVKLTSGAFVWIYIATGRLSGWVWEKSIFLYTHHPNWPNPGFQHSRQEAVIPPRYSSSTKKMLQGGIMWIYYPPHQSMGTKPYWKAIKSPSSVLQASVIILE